MTNIVLIGFQGVGKSFFGEKLGKLLQRKWIDTDLLINGHFGNKHTNREIFLKLGEKKFRSLEKELLEGLALEEGLIISCGGGIVEIDGAETILPQLGTVIYLYEKLEILQMRWDNTPRVYLQGKRLEEMYARRDRMYKEIAQEQVEGKWDQILLANSLQSLLLESHMGKE